MTDASKRLKETQEKNLKKAWKVPEGWRYWSEVNNSEVGLGYAGASFCFFLFAGTLALLMRFQLAIPENSFLSAKIYNQIFTMHGTVMMFLFAIPIFEAISILILPQLLGARDLPFPRLSAYGFWCFLIGGIFVCASLFFGVAPEGGWFMYPPLTTKYQPGVGADIWLLGLTFIEIASIAASIELIVGILKCRPPGMRIHLMPIYAWYILVVAIMILFAFPPLIAGDILLEMNRAFDWPFFDPARGGDPLLWQHLFWIFAHPEVYIIFLPSVALVATILPTFARRPLVGYSWVVLSAIGTGFISFGLWVHHMFTTGLPGISLGIFSAASQMVAIPTGIQLFCFLATLLAGKFVKTVPMLFACGGMASFVIGGLTGVMLAIAPFDFQAHDSFFIVAHLHYVLIGGSVFPILGGIYYFFPLVRGKQLSEKLGRKAFWLILIGLNVTFFPMHFSGLLGMPRRVFTYSESLGVGGYNIVSTIGAVILATGILIIVIDVLRPNKRSSKRDPWKAGTLEWLVNMPPGQWGVRSIPVVESRYPLWQQSNFTSNVDEGNFYLPDAQEEMRETLVTTTVDARPIHCLRVPGPTFVTIFAAIFTGGFFIFSTYKWYWLATASGILALGFILYWLWTGTAWIPEKERKDVGMGKSLPLYASGPKAVGWWAMFITMLADLTAFISLVFGYFFYWTVHEDFPPEPNPGPGIFFPTLAAGLGVGAWALTCLSRRWNRLDNARLFYFSIGTAALMAAGASLSLLAGPWVTGLDPKQHVYPAIVWVLTIWSALHLGVGVIMQLYCAARRIGGKMSSHYNADITNVTLYWHFMALTIIVTVMVISGFPLLV